MVRLTGCWHPLVVLLVALMLGWLPATAQANSGPPRVWGDTGGPLLPGQSDQVHVLGETLRFDLSPDFGQATVTARYTLANRGPALDGQQFVFVVQDAGDRANLTATWQGETVPVRMEWGQLAEDELAEMTRAWTTVDVWLDPVTGEPYTEDIYSAEPVLRYYLFALDLPAGGEGELVVTYEHRPARDRTRHAYWVYQYHYLLLPARGWASFGPLEIRVAAPEGSRYYFAANLDFRQEGSEWVAHYPGLPDTNLAFAVMDRAGLFLGPSPTPYYWVGFVVVLVLSAVVGAGIGWVAGQIPHRGWATGVAILVGVVPGGPVVIYLSILVLHAIPALRDQSYGPALAGAAMGLVGAVVSTAVAAWMARRTRRRRPSGSGAAGCGSHELS